MSAKKAKQLRRAARLLAGPAGFPERDHIPDQVRRFNGNWGTRQINDPNTVRGVYRDLKKRS